MDQYILRKLVRVLVNQIRILAKIYILQNKNKKYKNLLDNKNKSL